MSSVLGVIPARYAAKRFPGKPLANILGRPMVEWVMRAAKKALPNVVVATDDARIAKAVARAGGKALLTPRSCRSGTERMAHVAKKIRADFYVNIQGDEPMMHAETLRAAVALAKKRKAIATAVTDLDRKDFINPNVVKVAVGAGGRALYFSRAPVPYPRDGAGGTRPLKHIGVYVYPRKELLKFVALPATSLERTEMLEQLRALYHGMPIYVAKTRFDSIGVDTPKDLKRVAARLKKGVLK